ncbi:hypothetical protein [Aeromonas caviae]|uniref:hypothetical protein n=1 Tax=Aeromonas caviae TaxID=648 RepID=UPI002B45A4BF|nr:hypothetical protein [Aeromonas caviae]
MLRIVLLFFVSFGVFSQEIKYSKDDSEIYIMDNGVKKSFHFSEFSAGNSERWFDSFDNKPAIVNDSNSLDSFSSYTTLIYQNGYFYIDCVYVDYKTNRNGLRDKTGFCGINKKIENGYDSVDVFVSSFSDKVLSQISMIDTTRLINGEDNYLSIVSYRDRHKTLNKTYEAKDSLLAGDYDYAVSSENNCEIYKNSPWLIYNGNGTGVILKTEQKGDNGLYLVAAKSSVGNDICSKLKPVTVRSDRAYIYKDEKKTSSYLIDGDLINYLYSDGSDVFCEIIYINNKNKKIRGSLLCADIKLGDK